MAKTASTKPKKTAVPEKRPRRIPAGILSPAEMQHLLRSDPYRELEIEMHLLRARVNSISPLPFGAAEEAGIEERDRAVIIDAVYELICAVGTMADARLQCLTEAFTYRNPTPSKIPAPSA
jgi:hypothetical protein